jgi:hypothetical protein
LENGKISEEKLGDKSVFTKDYGHNMKLTKFAFPAIKEGSIIVYSYNLCTNIQINLHLWEFQGKYPCLWSEYSASIPEMFIYVNVEGKTL